MQAYNVVNIIGLFIYLLVRICVNSEMMGVLSGAGALSAPSPQLNATEVAKQVLMTKSDE